MDTIETEQARAFAPCCCEDGGAGWRPAPERLPGSSRNPPSGVPSRSFVYCELCLPHASSDDVRMNGRADLIAAALLCLSMLQSLERSVATHSESVVSPVFVSLDPPLEAKCELLPPRPQALLRCARHRREERALTAIIVRFVTIAEF